MQTTLTNCIYNDQLYLLLSHSEDQRLEKADRPSRDDN